jgi:hypothetical protein
MTTTEDPVAAYIRQLHEKFDREREAIRTRTLALGYVFGCTAARIDGGDDQANSDHATEFADFYEQHTDGNWADISKLYAKFQSGKDTPK